MSEMNLYSVKNDINGNARVVVHFTEFLSSKETVNLSFDEGYRLAHKRANKISGKIYRGSDFGGGFVFQCHDERTLIENIKKTVNE